MDAQLDRVRQIAEGAEGETVLAEAALLLAREQDPRVDVDAYLARIDALVRRAEQRLPEGASIGDALFVLNALLFDEEGFEPEASSLPDAHASLLNEVLDNRSGDALTLGILYITIGRCLGLPLDGVVFPGHFLVMLSSPDEMVVIDPSGGGVTLNREDLELLLIQTVGLKRAGRDRLHKELRAADNRAILVRLLNNLKLEYLEEEAPDKALWAVNRILDLSPGFPQAVRDRARLLELLECPGAARSEYGRYLELAPDARDAEAVRRRIARLDGDSVTLH